MILKWYHCNMKLLTRNTDYAVRAICSMAARPNNIVTATELVSELKIPKPFLRKILQILNKKGIVKSTKGSGGGFVLARKPNDIYLVTLIEAFQGPLSINECIFKKRVCPNRKTCPLKKKITEIENKVENELRSITIGSLLSKG